MTRTGKIARLPRDIRDQLNRRMADGEPGVRLVEWLNGLPQVASVLTQDFEVREISEQNLSEWKQGGHQEWLSRQEMLATARELAGDAAEITEAADGSLADHLSIVLSSRYAALVSSWNGELNDDFKRKLRSLRTLCQDIAELRRGDHYAERLRLDVDRFAESSKADAVKALETVVEETKQWPEVRKAFQDAFALYRRQTASRSDSPPAGQTKSNQIKPVERDL